MRRAKIATDQFAVHEIFTRLIPGAEITTKTTDYAPYSQTTIAVFNKEDGPWKDFPEIKRAHAVHVKIYPNGGEKKIFASNGSSFTQMDTTWGLKGPAYPDYASLAIRDQIALAIEKSTPNLHHEKPHVSFKKSFTEKLKSSGEVARNIGKSLWDFFGE